MMQAILWRAGGLAVLVFLAVAPAFGQRLERPDWRVGDTWEFRISTTPAGGSRPPSVRSRREVIGSMSPEGIELSVVEEESGRATEMVVHWTVDGAAVSRHTRGQAKIWYRPPFQSLRSPAEPGQRWSTAFDVVADDGRWLSHARSSSTAVAWETITVPAGTFRALRVEAEVSDGRQVNKVVFWFAPEAKRNVRLDEQVYVRETLVRTAVTELVSFAPAR